MDLILKSNALLIALVVSFILLITSPVVASPKYLDATKQELARLGLKSECNDNSGQCVITDATGPLAETPNALELIKNVIISIDDHSNTIKISIESFLPISTETAPSSEYLLSLLEWNKKMVVSKISLNSQLNSFELSAIINTDSNFDRKTFRSVLKGFVETALQLKTELTKQTEPTQTES